jgi:predicted transcriptional regulator
MSVRDLFRVLPTLDKNSNLKEAIEIFRSSDSDAIVVLENKRPAGVLGSFEALEKINEGAGIENTPLTNLMNHNLLEIDADAEAKDAAGIMLAHKVWMAIVTENEEYVGIVTAGDLIKQII